MASARVHLRSKALALQVALLVLPLVVLSTVGFLSLRQDRAYAEHEATVHAQAIADDLLASFRALLRPGGWESNAWFCTFALNSEGELVSPAPISPPVAPQPLDPSTLDEKYGGLWNLAQQAEIREDWTNAIETWKRFIAANPPENFAAIADYSLGVAYEKSGQMGLLLTQFEVLAKQFPDSIGETGLPLAQLALFKSIDWANENANSGLLTAIDSFCSNIVTHPSFLTPTLLSEATRKATAPEILARVKTWLERLQRDQYSRAVAQAAIAARKTNVSSVFWVEMNQNDYNTNFSPADFKWLVVSQSVDTNSGIVEKSTNTNLMRLKSESAAFETTKSREPRRYYSQTQSQIERHLFAMAENMHRIPDYMGVSVSIAGKQLTGPHPGLLMWQQIGYFGRRGGGVTKKYLSESASKVLASASDLERGAELLGVSIWLTSPETLYRNQRARTFWFAALIAIASVGAAIGLVVVWRGFSRQVQLNEMKSNFVSSVSHELRAPIASVRLMAESLESGKLNEPQKKQEYYKFIGQECRRLSALIENVLDFARIEQGRKQYELEPTDVSALMRQTVALMAPYAAERQISLKLAMKEMPSEAPLMDGRAIQQALVNLIDNAIKHSNAGSEVTIGLDRISIPSQNGNGNSAAADWLQLWVEDQGRGIPADQHEKIFERFYRLGSELRRETPGVGIGLSIVKHIVDAHGGKILVRSSPGAGSLFTIQLPLGSENAQKSSAL